MAKARGKLHEITPNCGNGKLPGLRDERPRRNRRRGRQQHQRAALIAASAKLDAVLKARPGYVDLLQLPETVLPEVLNGALVFPIGRVRAELPVEHRPRQPHRSIQAERAVDQPHVQVKAEGRPPAQKSKELEPTEFEQST